MEKLRIPLLIIIFSSVFFFLGKAILSVSNDSKATKGIFTLTPFVPPRSVPLQGWQQTFSSSSATSLSNPSAIVIPRNSPQKTLAAWKYRYVRNNFPLDIQMLYVVNTQGTFKIQTIIKEYSIQESFSPPSAISRHRQGIGYYNLFAYRQRAYLNACINPRGGSTINRLQFMLNRNISDLSLNRVLSWLLDEAPLRDRRCLWAHLSVPLRDSPPENTYQILETAWNSWYQWWYPRFPKR